MWNGIELDPDCYMSCMPKQSDDGNTDNNGSNDTDTKKNESNTFSVQAKWQFFHNPEYHVYTQQPQNDAKIYLKFYRSFQELDNKKEDIIINFGRYKRPRGYYIYNDKRSYDEVSEMYYCWRHSHLGYYVYTVGDGEQLTIETEVYYSMFWEHAADSTWLTFQDYPYAVGWDSDFMSNFIRTPECDINYTIEATYKGNKPITSVKLCECKIWISDGRIVTWDEAKTLQNKTRIKNGVTKQLKSIDELDWYVIVPYTVMYFLGREVDFSAWLNALNHYYTDYNNHRPISKLNYNIMYSDISIPLQVSRRFAIWLNSNEQISNLLQFKVISNLVETINVKQL